MLNTCKSFEYMKINVLFFFLLLLLTNCGGGGKKSDPGNDGNNQQQDSGETVSPFPSESSIMEEAGREETANMLDGTWYVDDYLSTVEEARSVWKASEDSKRYGGVISCYFSKENLMSNSPMANGSSAHEGGFVSSLKWEDGVNAFKSSAEGYSSITEDPFSIYILNDTLMEFRFDNGSEPRKYRKIRDGDLSRWLNDRLFTGTYELKDGSLVKFRSDGIVEGHPELSRVGYNVVNDFFMLSMDAVRFFARSGKGSSDQLFHYKMTENGFELYEMVGNMETGYELGGLANTFKKTQREFQSSPEAQFEASTNYFDLPPDAAEHLKELLGTEDLEILDESNLEVMEDYLMDNLFARSPFGPRITSNYFWYVYNALPRFVSQDERHGGYYAHGRASKYSSRERLLAYAVYRLDRSPENIRRLFNSFKPVITQMVDRSLYEKMGVEQKVERLIDSYNVVTSFNNYKEKLSGAYAVADTMTGKFVDHGDHREFREFENSAYGFSAHDLNEHVMKHLVPRQERFHSMPADLSFWMRRNHEGNMDVVYSILLEIQKMYSD